MIHDVPGSIDAAALWQWLPIGYLLTVAIEAPVTRAEFEGWIGDELRGFEACVDGLLARCGVAVADVDRVFLTGGSSLVPAVRRIFAERFGDARLDSGDEFVSVARGLALAAQEARRS